MAGRSLCCVVFLLFGFAAAQAEPFIYYRGILNAASYAPPGLPNGSIARGSIFVIFGRELGPAEGVKVSSFPLETTFQGVSIEVCQNTSCLQALPIFVAANQLNAIMPSNAPLGPVSIRVIFNGVRSNFTPAWVAPSSFGTFAVNSAGFGPGVIQNFSPAAQPINSATESAKPGQTVILWGTGLGAGLNADHVAPQAGDLPVNVEIWVGDRPVSVKRYSGRTPCCSGVDQVVFDIPLDAPTGCYVPVFVRAGGLVSNATTIAISAGGALCADPENPAAEALRAGGAVGRAYLVQTARIDGALSITTENLWAVFGEQAGGEWEYQADVSRPPAGACTVHQGRGASRSIPFPGQGPGLPGLDAGSITVAAGSGSRVVSALKTGEYSARLGVRHPEADDLLLGTAAEIRVSSAGGAGVGAWESRLQPAPSLHWQNEDALGQVDRNSGLTVRWTGAGEGDGVVWISGGGSADDADAKAEFSCFARPSLGQFTVPPHILAAIRPSRASPARSDGWLSLALIKPAHTIEASNLTAGFLFHYRSRLRTVSFR